MNPNALSLHLRNQTEVLRREGAIQRSPSHLWGKLPGNFMERPESTEPSCPLGSPSGTGSAGQCAMFGELGKGRPAKGEGSTGLSHTQIVPQNILLSCCLLHRLQLGDKL